jgi:predicted phage replisome organizer
MAEVKWIKIVTDIFDDEKILMIESMPEKDSIIVIWFKLLCLAGKQNNSGVFMFNDKIPYTDEMLSTIFRRPLNTVRLALSVFEEYGMIEIVNNTITIPKWDKHQQSESLELYRENNRKRAAKFREKQKEIACNVTDNVTDNVTVTLRNADRIDKNRIDKNRIDKIIDIDSGKPQKHKHGEFNHVLLTDDEYSRLCDDYGPATADLYIKKVDEYCEQSGKRYKNYNLAIRNTFMGRDNVKPVKKNTDPGYDPVNGWRTDF